MTAIQELINEVHQSGVILRADGPDLIIKPAERISSGLKAKLKANKAEVLSYIERQQVKRLENTDIRIVIFINDTDAGIVVTHRDIRTDEEAKGAVAEGGMLWGIADMVAYVELEPRERHLMRLFKKQFPDATWECRKACGEPVPKTPQISPSDSPSNKRI